MFDINRNGIITMNRGDSWNTEIYVNVGTSLQPEPCVLGDEDYIYFGVMEPNQPFEFALIRKRFGKDDAGESGAGFYKIWFTSKDTVALLPGTYYYEVKVKRVVRDEDSGEIVEEKIDTIIPKTKFVIYE